MQGPVVQEFLTQLYSAHASKMLVILVALRTGITDKDRTLTCSYTLRAPGNISAIAATCTSTTSNQAAEMKRTVEFLHGVLSFIIVHI
jgi:hypothetical protein